MMGCIKNVYHSMSRVWRSVITSERNERKCCTISIVSDNCSFNWEGKLFDWELNSLIDCVEKELHK